MIHSAKELWGCNMKKKIWSVVLCFCLLIPVFCFIGCGGVSLDTVKQTFTSWKEAYVNQSSVFSTDTCEGYDTDYYVAYNSFIEQKISDSVESFSELRSKYNLTLAFANDYIEAGEHYLTIVNEEDLSKNAKKMLKTLNKSAKNCTEAVSEFAVAKRDVEDYFQNYGAIWEGNQDAEGSHLNKFKNVYASLIEKSVDLSSLMADFIKEVGILEIFEKVTISTPDVLVVRDYVSAKLLPLFSKLSISATEKNLNWEVTQETSFKERINEILNSLNSAFNDYKNHFVDEAGKNIVIIDVKEFMSQADQFFISAESYIEALEGLNIPKLATTYKNDLEQYKKKNKLAEIYLDKIENFVDVNLAEFLSFSVETIYGETI